MSGSISNSANPSQKYKVIVVRQVKKQLIEVKKQAHTHNTTFNRGTKTIMVSGPAHFEYIKTSCPNHHTYISFYHSIFCGSNTFHTTFFEK